ncbi:hypothetical protein [Pollutibacter soli]|uniref:hypothetical protein n=1 Tax=Pollutibacter soli TaxID=3034157 RepID=UPI00301387CB
MKKILSIACILLLFTGTGCLNTFYPIFGADDVIDPKPMYGEWFSGNEKMIITPADHLSYQTAKIPAKGMIVREFNSEGIEETTNLAFLVKIGDHYFLDMFPGNTPGESEMDPIFRSMFLKQHSVYRVDSFQLGNKLFIQQVSDHLIREQLEKKKIRIPMISRGDESIILASTSELQTHIRKYANDPVLYESNSSHSYHRSK